MCLFTMDNFEHLRDQQVKIIIVDLPLRGSENCGTRRSVCVVRQNATKQYCRRFFFAQILGSEYHVAV